MGYAALEASPWPAALVYRFFLNRGGETLNQALAPHVPPGVTAVLDERYEPEAALDVYYPAQADRPLPTIVWVHGGHFLAGRKEHVGNYLRILAAKGYTTVAVGYSIGPSRHYPVPVRQVNAALAYLARHAPRLRVDAERFFLAGDSAGAHVAAQLANSISVPSYAAMLGIAPSIRRAQLRGVILFCGVYDFGLASTGGRFGHLARTTMWSYSGRRDAFPPPELSVNRFVTADFPPALVSAGNADPLLEHSRVLADALARRGVSVDSLFFAHDHRPELPHEYQFNLDTEAGRLALERTLRFVSAN